MRILMVEDEVALAEPIVEILRDECYAVDLAEDGETAAEMVDINTYDLVLLDWSIPGPSGIELLRRWRSENHEFLVLMLTAHDDLGDRVGGLDAGADDYLTKPFRVPELLARVRSLMRRAETRRLSKLSAGDVSVDRATREVTVAGTPINLSPKEFGLLEFFLHHVDEVVTRTMISDHVWDEAFDPMSNAIDVAVHRLRRKLDGDRINRMLWTVKGVGYVLRSERSTRWEGSQSSLKTAVDEFRKRKRR